MPYPEEIVTVEIARWECAMVARGIALVIADAQMDLDLSEIHQLVKLFERFRIASQV